MMQFEIKEITENDIDNCKTPSDIVTCLMSLTNQVMPNLQSEIKGFEKTAMNDYQIAYSLAKGLYEQFDKMSEDDCKAECQRLGVVLKRGDSVARDKWSEISSKYDHKYKVNSFMYLKYDAEKQMVENAFRTIEADPCVKMKIAENDEMYEKIKTNWEKPVVRQKMIDLAFKLRV